MPPTSGIIESALYIEDIPRSVRFYEEVFGLRKISDFGERGCAMSGWQGQVLLLFKKGAPQAILSHHDGTGELHIAFGVAAADLPSWEAWLQERGIDIEERRTWPGGGLSVYFRDPDRHLLELVTPGTWSVY